MLPTPEASRSLFLGANRENSLEADATSLIDALICSVSSSPAMLLLGIPTPGTRLPLIDKPEDSLAAVLDPDVPPVVVDVDAAVPKGVVLIPEAFWAPDASREVFLSPAAAVRDSLQLPLLFVWTSLRSGDMGTAKWDREDATVVLAFCAVAAAVDVEDTEEGEEGETDEEDDAAATGILPAWRDDTEDAWLPRVCNTGGRRISTGCGHRGSLRDAKTMAFAISTT